MRCLWWSSVSMHGTHLAHLPIFQLFSQSPTNSASKNLRNQNAEIIESDPPILTPDLFNLRDCLVGNWRSPAFSSSWISVRPAVNSLHHLRMFLTSMNDSPYTSVNWLWIWIGLTPFAFKNRITAQTSLLAGATGGSSITNVCRAKTERPSGLSDGLFGSGGTNEHSSVANSHANSFTAAPALWRPYFWDHPRTFILLTLHGIISLSFIWCPLHPHNTAGKTVVYSSLTFGLVETSKSFVIFVKFAISALLKLILFLVSSLV